MALLLSEPTRRATREDGVAPGRTPRSVHVVARGARWAGIALAAAAGFLGYVVIVAHLFAYWATWGGGR